MTNIKKLAGYFANKLGSDQLSDNELVQELARQEQVPLLAKRLEKAMAHNLLPGKVDFVLENETYMALYTPENDELGAVMAEGKTPYEALSKLMTDLIENKIKEFKNYLNHCPICGDDRVSGWECQGCGSI